MGELGRLMAPMEKLSIHLLPVHTLQVPPSLTEADIADLGGNTMHLLAAGSSVALPGYKVRGTAVGDSLLPRQGSAHS